MMPRKTVIEKTYLWKEKVEQQSQFLHEEGVQGPLQKIITRKKWYFNETLSASYT